MSIMEERTWTIDTGRIVAGEPVRIAFRFLQGAPFVFVSEVRIGPDGDEFEASVSLEDFLAIADAIREMTRGDPLGDAIDRQFRQFTARKHGESEEPGP